MSRMGTIALGAVLALATVAGTGPLQAQGAPERNHLYDRLQFSLSGTNVWLGSRIRIDPASGSQGTDVDGGALGANNSSFEPRLALRWRLGHRHELEFGYQVARHGGERVLTDTITIGDSTFAAGLRIKSGIQSDQAFVNYRFAFRARERSQIGVALGLGALLFKVNVDAIAGATSGGPDTAITQFAVEKSLTAPTASLGLYGRWRSGSRWYIESDARALYFAVGRISAGVIEAGAAARYFVSPHFGFEAGYGLTRVALTLDPNSNGGGLAGKLSYTLQNARLGVVATP
jgi:hypothetical protein